jgi:hypothetical protein
VVDLGAAVLDVTDVGFLGDGAGLGARMPDLELEGAGPTATESLARGQPMSVSRAADLVLPMHSASVSHSSPSGRTGGRCRDTPRRCRAAVPAPPGTSPRPQPEIEVELIRLLVMAWPSSAPGSHCCQRGSAYTVPSLVVGHLQRSPAVHRAGSRPAQRSTPTYG